jgi:hypothetical protein
MGFVESKEPKLDSDRLRFSGVGVTERFKDLVERMYRQVTVHENQEFSNRAFVLDSVVFIRCRLTNCDLFYHGEDFEWIGTTFKDCRFHWRGAARNTFVMFKTLEAMAKESKEVSASAIN